MNDPNELHRLFADSFNRGAMAALLALYEPDPTLVPQAGNSKSAASMLSAPPLRDSWD
jgi:hypothetical protein